MEELGLKRIPGLSWIEVDGDVHSFVVQDKSHPRTAEIYAKLNELHHNMRVQGYIPDTAWVTREMGEEQKEDSLCYHRCVLYP
jgi:hypothetical protein